MALSPSERQRRYKEKRWAEIEALPKIECACGCGTLITPFTKQFKPKTYAHGHNPGGEEYRFVKGQKSWNKGLPNPTASRVHKGKKLTPDEIRRRTETRLKNNGGVYQKNFKGHPDGWLENVTEANRKRDITGENNPFYNKTHTEETRKLISQKLTGRPGRTWTPDQRANFKKKVSGRKHWNWKGGHQFAPYGPDYTHQLRTQIRKRDNYTCQRCGVTQDELSYTIHVHHLDHNKFNNNPENLVCACAKCNGWAIYHRDEPFVSQ